MSIREEVAVHSVHYLEKVVKRGGTAFEGNITEFQIVLAHLAEEKRVTDIASNEQPVRLETLCEEQCQRKKDARGGSPQGFLSKTTLKKRETNSICPEGVDEAGRIALSGRKKGRSYTAREGWKGLDQMLQRCRRTRGNGQADKVTNCR